METLAEIPVIIVALDEDEKSSTEENGFLLFYKNLVHVEYYHGYERQRSSVLGDTVLEPETLHIAYVQVAEGTKLGTMALSAALGEARNNDFEVGRMCIINPRMIGVVEKLTRLEAISERHYILNNDSRLAEEPKTEDIAKLPDTVSAEIATDYLNQVLGKWQEFEDHPVPSEDHLAGCVDCVIRF